MQLLFPFISENLYHEAEFLIDEANKEAYFFLQNYHNPFGCKPYVNSVLLEGKKSSGKTYLAKIWANKKNGFFIKPNEKIDSSILENYQAFIIEDIDNKNLWNEENILFNFNLINEFGKLLLITVNSLYRKSFILPDLASRINSLFVLSIKEPEQELLKMLFLKICNKNSLSIPESVVNFILTRLPRRFDEIVNCAHYLNYFSMLYKRNVTLPFAREILHMIYNKEI